jgi:radical SAM family uncharacterized protein/radical SAM-linked protein
MSLNPAQFQKPSRYIGNEYNSIRKKADINIALCFPDTYEIGMSHLGLKILYEIINNNPTASAERVFAPWSDYEAQLREQGLPLTSLESKKPLKDFDIVGFTLQYELSYTNILNMLDLGGLPVRAKDRGDSFPVVIAGGPCAVNPLPISPFIDAFLIGDGEEVIEEIIEVVTSVRGNGSGGGKKSSLLKALSELEGIYVPALHQAGKKIKKRTVKDLDAYTLPEKPVVPYAQLIHDRVTIEISRGCSRGCRFCQAGMIYRPLRERSLEKVLILSQKALANTGYEEISFSSLSTGDYSSLLPLIKTFNTLCSGDNIAISLPSLRVGAVNSEVLREIKSIRKTGFTIAPEAGTERLRNVINKDFTEEEYENTLEKLFKEGWKSVKLYFMIGLPTETQKDLEGITRMVQTALRTGRRIIGKRVDINVGISSFVPKPHTPFQWNGQVSFKELRAKQDFLKNSFRKKGIHFKGQHVELSLLEAVFSRGGSDCSSLLETAWKEGCRFDSWSDHFDFTKWTAASEKTGIDLYSSAARAFGLNHELPWQFIDTGITEEFFKSEHQKALSGDITKDCRDICSGCGLECKPNKKSGDNVGPADYSRQTAGHVSINKNPLAAKTLPQKKLRVRFSKTGLMRYLSHREVITAIIRSFRRAGILLIYSKGFHPHPLLSFGPPLPVGVEGENEYFDIELPAYINPHDILSATNGFLPDGLSLLAAAPITKKESSLDNFISRYEYEIIIDNTMPDSIHSFLNLTSHLVNRNGKTVDIRPMVEKAEINKVYLKLILVDSHDTKVRLHEVLKELVQKQNETVQTLPIKRVRLYGRDKEGWRDPLETEKIWQMR